MPYAVVAGLCLLVLLGKVAWGGEGTTQPDDVWQAVGIGVGVILTGVGGSVAYWLRSDPDRRRPPADPAPVPVLSAVEVRAMITEALQRIQADGEGQHRRIRETQRELEARLVRVEDRVTTNEHASMERRAEQARELGEIASDVRHLRRALE